MLHLQKIMSMEQIYFAGDGSGQSRLSGLLEGEREVLAVMDRNVAPCFAGCLTALGVRTMLFEATEERKSLEGLQEIVAWLLEQEADRGALLLGIGGGITTDITGLAASVYKRGVRYALVPTTLLAQVDASVGGKTGVNFHNYKNVLGTFGTPEWVCMDSGVLSTLPERELRSGMAEALKTFVIGDAAMFRETVRICAGAGALWPGTVLPWIRRVVRRCVDIKSGIVDADRTEKGERMKLNLGHTLGHAIESLCMEAGAPVSHGEAVAAGIMAAAGVSVRKGILSEDIADELYVSFKLLGYSNLKTLLESRAGLCRGDAVLKLTDFVLNDKKRKEDFINFVLVRDLGSVMVCELSVREIQEVVNDLY